MTLRPSFKLTPARGAASGQAHNLDQASQTIGRLPDNDIVVESAGISRRHARLTVEDGCLFLEDLNSSKGTFVNGRRIDARESVAPGDRIRLGDVVEFIVEAPAVGAEHTMLAVAPPPTESAAPEPAPPPTILGDILGDAGEEGVTPAPPSFIVEPAGGEAQTYTLSHPLYTLGRAEGNGIRIESRIISRHHAALERVPEGYRLVPLPDVVNPIHLGGRPLTEPRLLRHGDLLRVGGSDPGTMVTMRYLEPGSVSARTTALEVTFGEKNTCRVGRDPGNDLRLDAPQVSRHHAEFERVGSRCRVRDLRSANGTFVNGRRIDGEVWLKPDDDVRIGPYRFVMGQDRLAQVDDAGGARLEAAGLNQRLRPDLNLLQDISLAFQPREFIVVVGQSGGGKSTLINALAGYRPATRGHVRVNGLDAYRDFDAIRSDIGFVPQKDIVHGELTAFEALDFAAQLRMPPDTSPGERRERVMQVLEDLDLAHRKDVPVGRLSGGQVKRVSIGVELLTKPGLFFLDEPTSGLDPATETALMQLMRRLADQGRTIVLVTHATKNVMLADKVVVLARGGHLAWFGPPDEALEHFDQYRTERERRAADIEFDHIYALLDDPARGSPEEWSRRYANGPAHSKYITRPLQDRTPDSTEAQPARPARAGVKRRASWLRQFRILSARHWRILSRDRAGLGLMLAAAPVVGLLDVALSLLLGRRVFDAGPQGNAFHVMTSMFLLAVFGVTVGALAQMREIVKEAEVYRRERLVNLEIFPYVASKLAFAALLSLYHALAYTIIHYLSFEMPGGAADFLLIYACLFLATLSGMTLGLFASALSPNANAAPLIVILLVLPQIVLGGALVPLPGERLALSAPMATRWALEGFMAITGLGSDVSADACWALPPGQRDSMSLDDKATRGCRCMGTAVFDPDSCDFPGLGQFHLPALNDSPPVPPPPLGDTPAEPALPARPQAPADLSDEAAVADFVERLNDWQAEVDEIQAGYRSQVEAYQIEAELYRAQSVVYQEARMKWEIARLLAVQPAEALIGQIERDFGWAFVNRDAPAAFWPKLGRIGLAQLTIIAVLVAAILLLQKRKDAV